MNKNQEMPRGWSVIKVGLMSELLRGVSYKKEDASNTPKTGYLPILRANNINSELNFDDLVYVPKKYIEDYQIVKAGDILFAMSSGSKHLVGKSAFAKNDFNGSFGAFCGLLRINDSINKKFISNIFKGDSYRKHISEVSKGTNINNLKRENILDFEISLPPLPEQQRIVAKIEELFSSLDKGIESLKTAQQQLKVYRQAVLKWAFEGKLTNKNVKEGELPEGWKWLKLDDVVDEFVRGPFGGSLKKECFVPKGYKVYEQKNAIYQSTELGKYFINENKFKELIRFKVKPYDFIVSCSGTIGKLFMIPEKAPKGIINQALLIIRINRDLLLEKFFMHLFTSSFFQRLIIKDAKGTAMLNLAGVKDMKLVPVLLPPIREQQAIVAEIESRLSVCDKIEESIEQSLKQAEALRQSILKKAFEGKLFSQDPNDEPASKLLERIKVEREKTAIKKRSKN